MSVTFQNKGLIDLRGLTTFGVCAKETDNPIGYFGTGLKYALAVLLREGLKVTLYNGDERYTFSVNKQTVRNKQFNFVQMNKIDLAFTTDLGKNWELWMAYRELAANAFDEEDNTVNSDPLDIKEGYTTFVVEGSAIDKIHEDRNQIFLSSTPKYSFPGLDIHDDLEAGGWVYYRGIRVYKLDKPALYNYNLTAKVKLTEDRTLTSVTTVYLAITRAIVKCDEPALIRQLLLADSRHFESRIDYHWWGMTLGETFVKVVERYINSGTSFNTSARDLYREKHPKVAPPAIIQIESIPMEMRRKLWAALLFWDKLGIEIPKSLIHVTTDIGTKKGKVVAGHIYISEFVLAMDMRFVSGFIYKLYCETKPTIGEVKQEDLFIDTIVDFGERLLGVSSKEKVA